MNESQTKSELNPFIESGKSDTFEHHRGDITHTGITSHGPIIRIHRWLREVVKKNNGLFTVRLTVRVDPPLTVRVS